MPRPKERTPQLRDRVLASAVDLLARDGVAAFTARGVAREAQTSPPAIYELYGDKGGLIRAVFFEGWRRLGARLKQLPETDDPRADLVAFGREYRAFCLEHRQLAEVMLARPFTDFDPTNAEGAAGGTVREWIVARVQRCVDAGVLHGDPIDLAHAMVALVQGLAMAENAQRLGTSQASVDRRWDVAINALLDGFAQPGG
jgi:AcrR family transcriptional regulator